MKKVDTDVVVNAYKRGKSMNAIAKAFNTYPSYISRILKKNNVELRHDAKRAGTLYVSDGEKLIDWAKAQNRLVTKAELAEIIGTKKLSPSYFIKYPELGKYVQSEVQNDLAPYYKKLYKWLQDNDIPYKPNDRTKLKVSVDALLLNEYSNLAICIAERPRYVCTNKFNENMKIKKARAKSAGITIIFLTKKDFENLDSIKDLLKKEK